MSDSHQPETTVSSTVAPLQGGGIVQQSHSAAANKTDVAASTSTAIAVPGGRAQGAPLRQLVEEMWWR